MALTTPLFLTHPLSCRETARPPQRSFLLLLPHLLTTTELRPQPMRPPNKNCLLISCMCLPILQPWRVSRHPPLAPQPHKPSPELHQGQATPELGLPTSAPYQQRPAMQRAHLPETLPKMNTASVLAMRLYDLALPRSEAQQRTYPKLAYMLERPQAMRSRVGNGRNICGIACRASAPPLHPLLTISKAMPPLGQEDLARTMLCSQAVPYPQAVCPETVA